MDAMNIRNRRLIFGVVLAGLLTSAVVEAQEPTGGGLGAGAFAEDKARRVRGEVFVGAGSGQEPPKLDVFAGGGMGFVPHETNRPADHVGGGVWVARNWRVGGRLDKRILGHLSVHRRIRMTDDWGLLVGASPVLFW